MPNGTSDMAYEQDKAKKEARLHILANQLVLIVNEVEGLGMDQARFIEQLFFERLKQETL